VEELAYGVSTSEPFCRVKLLSHSENIYRLGFEVKSGNPGDKHPKGREAIEEAATQVLRVQMDSSSSSTPPDGSTGEETGMYPSGYFHDGETLGFSGQALGV